MRTILFVDYNGHYPTLCFGVLTYSVDEELFTVSSPAHSGGSVWFENGDERVEEGKWELKAEKFPGLTNDELENLERQFNAHVAWGCCGGCI